MEIGQANEGKKKLQQWYKWKNRVGLGNGRDGMTVELGFETEKNGKEKAGLNKQVYAYIMGKDRDCGLYLLSDVVHWSFQIVF